MRVFQNYHRHTYYTNPKVSDSIVSNEDYAKRAIELQHGIISSCEHGYQGRYIEGFELAQQHNLKFLFSTEAYWVKDRFEKDGTNAHIFIAARNENGRQAINDALSEANISGFYRQARLDQHLILELPPKDVIVTTACIAFWRYPDIDDFVYRLQQQFQNNFFLEVQYHNTKAQRQLNQHILQLHNKWGIPLIMGCDSHYINADAGQLRTNFLVSKDINYPDEAGWYLDYPDGDEAYRRFSEQCVLSHSEICDAMDNTNVFLDVEEYDNPCFSKDIKMPSLYPNATQHEKNKIYKKLVWEGWSRYKHNVPVDQHNKYQEQIEKEIHVVTETGMADYFIDNYHIIRKGKENGGWLTKSGRGSAVSFVTNMLLGFTDVDRLAASVKMYPERFMSAERILTSGSLPDIDFNVSPVEPFAKAQKEVLGEDHAYPMIAYGTMQQSAAWKLYAKSQDVPFSIANEISMQLKKYEMALKHADEDEKETINPLDYINEEFHEIYEKSKEYRGVITNWSIAPSAYLLYHGSIRKEIGLVRIKDHLCCLMDGKWAEQYHFLKNDLLKVVVVDLIYKTFQKIGKDPMPVGELLKLCPPEDSAWDIYKNGCTIGINQYERQGTSARAMRYQPRTISESCAFVAAIRPGFKSMYQQFESRKPFAYGVKAFDDLIQTKEMPNSFVLYQEMEMAALNYAGIPMSDCYTAIKNIAKKRTEKVLSYKERFIKGFTESILQEGQTQEKSEELAHKLWKIVEDSASYSFNASHSYCVAIDSLYCAWLKAHYPLEFYATYLQVMEDKGDKDKMREAQDEAEHYFNIKFPPLRFGQDNRVITSVPEENAIHTSIASIKGFGKSIGDILFQVGQNKFHFFIDVLIVFDDVGIKGAKIKPLILIDYFQMFGNCAELLKILDMFNLLKQGKAKTFAKSKLENNPQLEKLIARHGTDHIKSGVGKSYTITDMNGLLHDIEQNIKSEHIPEIRYKDKIANQMELIGYVDLTTGKEEDRKKLLVTDIYPLYDKANHVKWGYAVLTQSIGSGKKARLTAKTIPYKRDPIQKMDIIYADAVSRNKSGYWSLDEWHHINN